MQRIQYPLGIRFQCQRCAFCCKDTEERARHILLTKLDVERIKQNTKLQTVNFAYRITGQTPFIFEMKKINGKCIFLEENACKIYSDRPLICRCFPFWIEKTKKTFIFKVYLNCPGVGKGRLLSKAFFSKLLTASSDAYKP